VLEDHYFGSLRERILAFFDGLGPRTLAPRYPAKTAIPRWPTSVRVGALFERAPLRRHNMIAMEAMRRARGTTWFASA
jgi:glutamine synthetase type III